MNIFYYCILIGMVIFLTACVDSKQDIVNYVNQIKKGAAGVVEPLPANRQVSNVEYTAAKLRNPFVPASKKTEIVHIETSTIAPSESNKLIPQSSRPDADRPREYLEQFSLDTISMVGTLSKPNMNWGLVKDSNGMVHAVKIGDYMGQNSGRIVAITPDQIRMIETVPNGVGGWKQVRSVITLVKNVAPTDSLQNSGQMTAPPKGTAGKVGGAPAEAPAQISVPASSPAPTSSSGSSTESIGGVRGGSINTGGRNGY